MPAPIIMLFLSILFFSISAPLIISLIIIFICLLIGWKTLILFRDLWCLIIFLIIFFGGILVLFVYISTLAHNEMILPNLNRVFLLLPILLFLRGLDFSISSNTETSTTIAIFLFDKNFFILSISLISYLLLCLIVVSTISFFHFGALRKFYVNTS